MKQLISVAMISSSVLFDNQTTKQLNTAIKRGSSNVPNLLVRARTRSDRNRRIQTELMK